MKLKKFKASAVIYLIFFFTVFLAFSAFAIDGTIIFVERAKLQNITEATALNAAAEFDHDTPYSAATASTIHDDAIDIFKALNGNPVSATHQSFPGATVNVEVNPTTKQVLVSTEALSKTYFLGMLGVSAIKLKANAMAESKELPIQANYSNINWITANAAYHTDVISKDLNLNDTAILIPIGKLPSASIDMSTKIVNFGLLNATDGNGLSLGPGGFITIKLPAPIIDKPGPDLFIKEIGAIEGYLVFAGLDNDPQNPYVQNSNPGAGISWKNITCSAKPEDTSSPITPSNTSTTGLGTQAKFYGSGYFDIGASCSGLSMAKYIRIVDDNDESAYVKGSLKPTDTDYHQTIMYGESSTPTAGADIDYITVLNHVKLSRPSTFVH